ncbi:MAG: hypothetical protein JWN45_1839 [Acidobacteriaceae bacterium]|nr:hypothetical protein [Acidobacteriaceae bacterium]
MAKILLLAYDRGLLVTREALLRAQGHAVVGVLGNGEALKVSDEELNTVDVVIVGSAGAFSSRAEAVQHFKKRKADAFVLALRTNGYDSQVQGADLNLSVESPEEWLKAVSEAVASASGRRD